MAASSIDWKKRAKCTSCIVCSNTATVRIGLTDYTSLSTLTSAIKNIPYDGLRTNTSGGIWMMVCHNYLPPFWWSITRSNQNSYSNLGPLFQSDNLMTSANGDRSDVQNVAVLITDGCTNIDMSKTIPTALAAKVKGNHMVSIGIGGDVNLLELRAIASDPQTENVLFADSWTDLPGIVTSLVTSMCNGMGEQYRQPFYQWVDMRLPSQHLFRYLFPQWEIHILSNSFNAFSFFLSLLLSWNVTNLLYNNIMLYLCYHVWFTLLRCEWMFSESMWKSRHLHRYAQKLLLWVQTGLYRCQLRQKWVTTIFKVKPPFI